MATLNSTRFFARQRRRAFVEAKKFEPDVAAPVDMGTVAAGNPLTTPYAMPANSRTAVSFSVAVTAVQLTVATEGAVFGTPALLADILHRLRVVERARTLTPTCAIAGVVTIHVLDEWSIPRVVATGTFT